MSRGLFQFLEASGLNRLWSAARRDCIAILRYHGVVEDDGPGRRAAENGRGAWQRAGPPTRSTFRRQIEMIQRRRTIIPLDEALEMLAGQRPLRPDCVVLTFDDGYRNNAATAFEVLRERGAPAAFFLATGFLDRQQPLWFDRLEYALAGAARVPCIPLRDGDDPRLPPGLFNGRGTTFEALKTALKRLDNTVIDGVVSRIEEAAGRRLADAWLEDECAAPMSWDDARRLRRAGMIVGSHTVTHQILTAVDAERAWHELADSKARIEAELGEACRFFAYPNGSPEDFSAATRRLLIETGYECALTTVEGPARRGHDPLSLRRLAVGAPVDPHKLLAELSGLLPAMLRVRDGVRALAEPLTRRAAGRWADAAGD